VRSGSTPQQTPQKDRVDSAAKTNATVDLHDGDAAVEAAPQRRMIVNRNQLRMQAVRQQQFVCFVAKRAVLASVEDHFGWIWGVDWL
jgi:hypothetical protein